MGAELDKYKVVVLRELDLRGALPLPAPPSDSRTSSDSRRGSSDDMRRDDMRSDDSGSRSGGRLGRCVTGLRLRSACVCVCVRCDGHHAMPCPACYVCYLCHVSHVTVTISF